MNSTTKRRIGLCAYFVLGTAIGVYLIHLLVTELEVVTSLDNLARTVPVGIVVLVYFFLPLYAATQSWRLLFPPGEEPALGAAARLTWIGLSVNWLLPVALVGGELVKLRLALRRVPRLENLVASLVGDKTIQVATQLLYTLLGVCVLGWVSAELGGGLREAAGFVLFCAAVYLFYRLQRAGMFAGVAKRLKALVRDHEKVELQAGRIDMAIDNMYRRRGRWWVAVGWRILFRVLLAAEIGLTLWWLGEPVGIWTVLALESLAQAARVAAIVIPAALGAQETVIMAAGLLLGYPAEGLLAVAVVKRVRELVVGVAGLLAWQARELRAFVPGS